MFSVSILINCSSKKLYISSGLTERNIISEKSISSYKLPHIHGPRVAMKINTTAKTDAKIIEQ
jgi:hypothetical protein